MHSVAVGFLLSVWICVFAMMRPLAASLSFRRGLLGPGLSLLKARSLSSATASAVHKNESVYLQRLQDVRSKMQEMNVGAFVVPTDDPHMSEYTAEYFNRREFISGFTGSAGVALITSDNAYLFTDGRYHEQAELELPSTWTLMKQGIANVPTWQEFVGSDTCKGLTIGIDPFLHPHQVVASLQKSLGTSRVKLLQHNLIDTIWTKDRPQFPCTPLRVHPLQWAGRNVSEKLHALREVMVEHHATTLVVSSLDEIMWLFNIRGSDVQCNPVSISYAVITSTEAILFIDPRKITAEVAQHLADHHVTLRPYDDILTYLTTAADASQQGVWIDTTTANAAIVTAIPPSKRFEKESPIVAMKAVKNPAELAGMRACHLRDGAAFVEFISWLDEELTVHHNDRLTEVDLDLHLTASRASYNLFLEPSFPTIAGVNSNGAIIHYRAEPTTCKTLTRHDMLLLDSGGQYADGTTDVTRTFHFGVPTDHQKNMYTRVLKGHIAIDRLVFPVGTPGYLLDSHARIALWAVGKNYNHGTGHGVGAALNVHERPQSLSPRVGTAPFVPGMIISNEPGYYEPGAFGVRIENLLVVQPRPDLGECHGKTFCSFERLTFIPIQTTCLQRALLQPDEIDWINTYHAEVREKITPLLRTDRARRWLMRATQPLP